LPAADADHNLFAEESAKVDAGDTVPLAARHADPHATRCDGTPRAAAGGTVSDVALASSSAPTRPYRGDADRGATSGARGVDAGDVEPPLSQAAVRRFRIVQPLQKGGLGQVSLARDEELHREVALKEILPKHADSSDARQRFLMEAEITGSLEHPGVVPVYGLGQYADGRPFYAMRLIRGENLQLVIEEYHREPHAGNRELKFRQLLGRFVDVCNAIEYAHNRCVLHRDLKPGNIMLGKYGETLVVDWGLAKAVDVEQATPHSTEAPVRPLSAESSTETQMGRVVGTPAYMSPEQASGRVDMIGPASDVYSLGATLYHLLTGRAPFVFDDPDDALGNVQMGRFDPPRSVQRRVPRSLEAVCLKAMARRPADRYPSARALADDVERFLADEPVLAYAEPLSSRAWRWMRRHRAAVFGTGAVLTAVAASLAIGLVLLNAANRRAEYNFDVARKAIRGYFLTVSENPLLERPDMQPLREQLLRQALEYYEQFLISAQREPELRGELAQANFFVGQITESIESPERALRFFQQAQEIHAELVAEKPDDSARQVEQARTLAAMGGTLQKLQRWDESRTLFQQAEAVQKKLVDAHPENAEYARTLAKTRASRAAVDAARGNAQREPAK
jgi:serine/threonine-protein kinase